MTDDDIHFVQKKLLNTQNVIVSKKRRIAYQRHLRYLQERNNPSDQGGWFNMIRKTVTSSYGFLSKAKIVISALFSIYFILDK